jgi:ABC-type Fe3+/spermidine/putrescine transport system ATPase subunit
MRVELRKLIREVGISALYVTHDQEEASTISDAVIVMEGGRILQYDAPDVIYNSPAHPFVASFIGHSALVNGKVVSVENGNCVVSVSDFGGATLITPAPKTVSPGDLCKLVIRTGEIRLSNEKFVDRGENILEGRMTSREYRGGLTDHRIQVGAKEIVVTSHKFCPMIKIEGDTGSIFLSIDKSAISVIVSQ